MIYTTLHQDGGYTLGVRTGRGILDVRRAARSHQPRVPATTDDLIRDGAGDLAALVDSALAGNDESLFVAEAAARFGPCVTRPQKILCVGLNYRRHAREINLPIPATPVLFGKFNNSLNHHGGTVRVSSLPAEQFDYEAELVIVIGRRARNVGEAQALDHVFGYCTGNDFSARDLQMRTSQWLIGKTADGFAPLGPWLVSADQVPDPDNLTIECRVNGEVRQSSNTNDMIFNCAQIVSYASMLMTLEPGDLIFTGTPEGVILGHPKDRQVWLKAGDTVATTIEKTGELSFTLA